MEKGHSDGKSNASSAKKTEQIEVEADTWKNVVHSENKGKYEPSERYGHTACEVTNNGVSAMYVLGGGDAKGQFCRELLEFDFESLSFLPPSEVKLFEHGRHFHSTVVFNKCLYVFGGKSNGYFNDVHCLETGKNKWTKLETTGKAPSRRYGHSSCFWNNKMVVFGGYDNEGFTSNEVFMFDLQQHSWELITVKSQDVPTARYHHTCVVLNDKMMLFGGRDADNNVWEFDLINHTWNEVKVKGTKPSPRYGHTWTFVGGDLAPTLIMFGGTNGKEVYNQLWSYNIVKKSWKSLANDKKINTPPPRYFHTALNLQGFLLVFGGRNNEDLAFNDFVQIPIRISYMPTLPTEIMMKVFEQLDLAELTRAGSVCKKWKQLTEEPYLWKDLITRNSDHMKDLKDYSPDHFKTVMKLADPQIRSESGWGDSLPKDKGLALKIVIVGENSIGKTSFIMRFAEDKFAEDYLPTVFDNTVTKLTHNGIPVLFSLWDTYAGSEGNDRLRPLSYPETNVFIIMYSRVWQYSYNQVTAKWYPEVMDHVPDAARLLVGTKEDLVNDPSVINQLKEKNLKPITDEEGEQLRQQIGAKAYLTCSAKTGYNMNKVIKTATELALVHIFNNTKVTEDNKKRCVVM